jgi:hypothetical protein
MLQARDMTIEHAICARQMKDMRVPIYKNIKRTGPANNNFMLQLSELRLRKMSSSETNKSSTDRI